MRLRLLALLSTVLVTLGIAVAPVQASTGGTPTGEDKFSNVALILYYTPEGRFRCSATLISPTVLVTAAHCTDGVVGSTLVTFDANIAEKSPTPFPLASDPAAGYTDEEITDAGYLSGSSATHPEYSDFTDMDNWYDVGVVVLDQAVSGIEPATLAEPGTLSEIPKRKLRKTIFTAVGYGTEVRKAETGPQNPQAMTYPLIRRYVEMPGQKLTPQILQTNGNDKDNAGTGGTCFGDSGGPVFLDGEIVAVTSYTYNSVCRYLGGYQRVDRVDVQGWIAQYL